MRWAPAPLVSPSRMRARLDTFWPCHIPKLLTAKTTNATARTTASPLTHIPSPTGIGHW
jgi:hypothetical protein